VFVWGWIGGIALIVLKVFEFNSIPVLARSDMNARGYTMWLEERLSCKWADAS
jgi:hypothetical protein